MSALEGKLADIIRYGMCFFMLSILLNKCKFKEKAHRVHSKVDAVLAFVKKRELSIKAYLSICLVYIYPIPSTMVMSFG